MQILGQPGLCCSRKRATEQKGGKRKGGKGAKIEEKGGAEERHVLDFGFPVLMLKRWVWRDGRDDDSPV